MPVDAGHVEALGMIAALDGEQAVVHGAVEVDNRTHAILGSLVSAGVVHEEAAGGFSDDGDLGSVHVVFGGVCLHPAYGAVHIVIGLREAKLGGHPVVNAEPGESSVGQEIEERADIGALAALVEAAAVDQNRRGEGTGAVGYMEIEQDGLAARARILHIFLIERRACQGHSSRDRQNQKRSPHGTKLYQDMKATRLVLP